MKLYSLPHSPYAARVRMQIRLRELPVDVLPPPLAMRTAAFLERFPLGKVPVLELEDGASIAESWAIMEYLEELDIGTGASLSPASPLERARMRMLGRYADLHLATNALFPLFRAVTGMGGVDAASTAESLRAELAKGERLLLEIGAGDRALHLGDIALAPTLLYVQELAPAAGIEAPLKDYPRLSAWWDWVNGVAPVRETLEEVREAFRAFAESLAAKA